jgi:hypothetical protein
MPPPLAIIGLVWFFGWAFLLLKFPNQSFRFMTFGKRIPTTRELRVARVVGYIAVVSGCLLLVQSAIYLFRQAK